ncbi:MAG: repair pathway polymerase beta family [Chthoniobacteraceae bacterium]|nr:repair pathway polymerase beta family [Chthoniobacteraceae bacterium]
MNGNSLEKRVRDQLARVENEFNVRVLFACESGSRAWGLSQPIAIMMCGFFMFISATGISLLRPGAT